MKTLGERLIFLMELKDMKQTELAGAIEISKQSLYKYIHNLCEPRSEIIARMAAVLDTTADYIVGLTEDPSPTCRKEDADTISGIEMLSKIHRLTPENRIRIEERIDTLLEQQK